MLLTGEAGVGKAFVARLMRRRSPRASAPMVTLHCSGLPDALLESELFGHLRGSFPGAYRDKPGMLDVASGGTLFLDEVGDLSPRVQGVLLRFLESGEIRPVGAHCPYRRAHVRVVAASRLNLPARVESGSFDSALLAAIDAIHIAIPPLHERTDDLPHLVMSLLRPPGRAGAGLRIPPEALRAMLRYQWPGNVGELKAVVDRVVLGAQGAVVRLDDLPAQIRGSRAAACSAAP